MNNQSQQSDSPGADVFLYLFAGILAIFGLAWFYKANAESINWAVISFCRVQLFFVRFFPFDAGNEAAYLYSRLQSVDPASLSFDQVSALLRFTGGYARWFVVPVLLGLGLWGGLSSRFVSEYYRRVFSMQTLIKQNVKEFPCIAPIANRKRSILEEPMDHGMWMTVRQPIQWAQENGLLTDTKGREVKKSHIINKHGLPNLLSVFLKGDNNKKLVLDEQRAIKLFEKQLGPRFAGVKNLVDYQKGLAAAFMAFGTGDKENAQGLLDQMSLSFVEPEEIGGKYKIDVSGADELIEKHQDDDLLKYHTRCHRAFVYPYLMALYEDFAKAKGVLPSCEFIWLRPLNRSLWYSLNQMGGREAWIEASAPWEHYHTEKIVGRSIKTPEVKNAVVGLKTILTQKGWLAPEKAKDYDV